VQSVPMELTGDPRRTAIESLACLTYVDRPKARGHAVGTSVRTGPRVTRRGALDARFT
jgi:hypothetical protein